jgi:hypothetical protein
VAQRHAACWAHAFAKAEAKAKANVELTALVLLIAVGAYWLDSIRVREAAVRAAQAACVRQGLQLLDETVSCVRLRVARNDEGQPRLRRFYAFEFTDTGDNRRSGSVVLVGLQIESLELEPHLMM